MRVLVLGAGFGGLELTSKLSEEFGDDVEITLIDKSDSFVFGFSKLDVMFGRTSAEHVEHSYADQSGDFALEKGEFGSSRVRRWFGKDWTTT